jgi:hypothetical protein
MNLNDRYNAHSEEEIRRRLEELGERQVRLRFSKNALPEGWDSTVRQWLSEKRQESDKLDEGSSLRRVLRGMARAGAIGERVKLDPVFRENAIRNHMIPLATAIVIAIVIGVGMWIVLPPH